MRRVLAASVLLAATIALASPRVGLHEGFTRLVFDLPLGTTYRISGQGRTFEIRIDRIRLEANTVEVESPEVASYRVIPTIAGTVVQVYVAEGVKEKDFVLKGLDAKSFRLVVDFIGKAPAKPRAEPKGPDPPKPVVVIDPGHGGPDPGAVGYVVEKAVTLDIALRVKRLLEASGIQVVLTRDRDTDLAPPGLKDLWQRKITDLKKRAAMADTKKTLFVSIHVNSAPKPAMGIETYFLGRAIDAEAQALAVWENGGGEVGRQLTRETETAADKALKDLLAQANLGFSQKLAEKLQKSLTSETGSPDRGVQSAPLFVLRTARIPAVLVEVGFANHPTEGRRLAASSYRQKVAEGIARGILAFLSSGAYAYTKPAP